MIKQLNLTQKFFIKIHEDGFISALYKVCDSILKKWGKIDPIHKRRLFRNKIVNDLFKSTVKYGPFQSLKFSNDKWWGG
jgi:endonuclease I